MTLVKYQMTLVQQLTMPLNNCEVKEGGGEVKVRVSRDQFLRSW